MAVNLQDAIMNDMAQKMANEMDFAILAEMLVGLGWRKIILSPMTMEDSYEVDEWTAKHVKGNFETMGLVWVFEDEEDANWFALRWM
jgi:hypothetical protein